MPASTEVVARAAQYLGINRALQAAQGRRALILNYHAVVPEECLENPFTYGNAVGVREFGRQMAEVARVFHPMTAKEFLAWRAGTKPSRRRPVLVTFDDGYLNNLTYAAPILERYGVPAVVHLATGYIGTGRILWLDEIYWRVVNWPHSMVPLASGDTEVQTPPAGPQRRRLAAVIRESCKRISNAAAAAYLRRLRDTDAPMPPAELYQFLSWDDVRTLHARGFDIGSHTVEHPILSKLDPDQLASELQESKRAIERETGAACLCLAYPNGSKADLSPEVLRAARGAGYTLAFTVMGSVSSLRDDPLLLDRVYIPEATSPAHFRSRVSGLFGVLKRWTPEPVLRRRLS